MARFTRALRQQIVDDFTRRHNGLFTPALFIEEVRAEGPGHPAYEWFEWDDEKAATEHRLWQAREFVRDLKVQFEVQTVGQGRSFTVAVSAPQLLSPGDKRPHGGGYYALDPKNPEHIGELARQAAVDLARWLRRYEAALAAAGGNPDQMRKLISAMEKAAEQRRAA